MYRTLLRSMAAAALVAAGCSPEPVQPSTPDRDQSTVKADSPVEADGEAASTVTVTVLDAVGNPLKGVDVVLSSSSAADVIAQPAATGDDGITTGLVSSTQAGTSIITAKAAGVTLREVAAIVFLEACAEGQTRCGDACVDTTSSKAHCGACNAACDDGDNGTGVCVDSQCAITCDLGYDDCDGDLANGCEAALDSPERCGSCDVSCVRDDLHFLAQCTDPLTSTCGTSCAAGYGNCNDDSTDGCETPLSTPTHCGACNVSCVGDAVVNGQGFCADAATSQCGVTCEAGYDDCNGDAADGCEQPLDVDAHCGACGQACPDALHAFGKCLDGATGACGFTCEEGWADCDPEIPGCETSIAGDPDNCGACGTVCEGRAQGDAVCQASQCAVACQQGFADCNADNHLPQGDGCETDLATVGGECSCQASPTGATSGCLLADTNARTTVWTKLEDADGQPIVGATVLFENDDLEWDGDVEESAEVPGLYLRHALAPAATGRFTVRISAEADEGCGTGAAVLRDVVVEVREGLPANQIQTATGGCQVDGQLRVRVVAAEDGTPVEGAYVQVGPAESFTLFSSVELLVGGGDPDLPTSALTDEHGYATLIDAGDRLSGELMVTAGAEARAYVTIVPTAASDLVLALPKVALPFEAELSGTVTGPNFPQVDGKLDLALVAPALTMDFLSAFDLMQMLETDRAVSGSGPLCGNQSYQVAGNIVVPYQEEALCKIAGGESWKLTPEVGAPTDLFALRASIPLQALLTGGGSVAGLLGKMETMAVGIKPNVPTTVDSSGLSVPLESKTEATMKLEISGAPQGTLYALSLGDYDGGNGTGRLFLQGFTSVENASALTTTLTTAKAEGSFASATHLAGALTQGDTLDTSLVLDRATLDRTSTRTLTEFLRFPQAKATGRRFTWSDVGHAGRTPDLMRSELRRVTPTSNYTARHEVFWIVWSHGDPRLENGDRGFELPTLPFTAPRSNYQGFLPVSIWSSQFSEWFVSLQELGLRTEPVTLDRYEFGHEGQWMTRSTTDSVRLP